MTISGELHRIADKLTPYEDVRIDPLEEIISIISQVDKSFSGSWLGYHSRVYYKNFEQPPADAVFSSEWGLEDLFSSTGSVGDWVAYQYDDVIDYIYQRAKNIDLSVFVDDSKKVTAIFECCKSDALSIIHSNKDNIKEDKFFSDLVEKIDKCNIITKSQFLDYIKPKGKIICRDINALNSGFQVPLHISILCDTKTIIFPYTACKELKNNLLKLANHMRNKENISSTEERRGVNIFIGHGRSSMWRDLKDFVKDKLRLPYDEFNRVPAAGVTNITRLAQMLDQACIAFLVMTAEDEMADGNKHARMNVIHEVGLFQGRLGFERAIVLLEDGCEEFSNINGLGQIRFPKGNISAVFQDIREVLEREEIIT